jgi:hypothetical protein
MQTIVLEVNSDANALVGRVYVDGRKTSAYIVPSPDNRYLFTDKQLSEIDNELF